MLGARSLARSFGRLAMCAVAALSLTAAPLRAQAGTVHLTMDRMTRMFNAMKELAILGARHPEYADAITANGDSTEAYNVAALAKQPAVVAALARAGTTPREYMAISSAYLGAAMAVGMEKSVPGYKIPAGIDPANVAFMRAHQADLEALQKRMEAELRTVLPADSSSNCVTDATKRHADRSA